jgi:hypothetical protein
MSINEVSKKYGVSKGVLYSLIHSDPFFPVYSFGKRTYRVEELRFKAWLKARGSNKCKFSAEQLLRIYRNGRS